MKYFLSSICVLCIFSSCEWVENKKAANFPKKHIVYTDNDLKQIANKSSDQELFQVKRLFKDKSYANHTKKNAHQLTFDLFVPENERKDRPLVVLLHPGAFIMGSKDHDLIQNFAHDFASRGFVSLAANYRLADYSGGFGKLIKELFSPGKLPKKKVYRSLQDARSLLAYCQTNAPEWGADPNRIYLVGYSAGAILALNYAFIDEREAFEFFEHHPTNCLDCLPYEGETNAAQGPAQVRGVIALGGGIFDLNHIQTEDELPTLLIHGDKDKVVPFSSGIPFDKYKKGYEFTLGEMDLRVSKELSTQLINFLALPISGSQEIYQKLNKNVRLVELKGIGHEFNSSGAEYALIFQEMEAFFERLEER